MRRTHSPGWGTWTVKDSDPGLVYWFCPADFAPGGMIDRAFSHDFEPWPPLFAE